MRSDNEVQCMIMYVSRDRNVLGEVVDDYISVNCWECET